MSDKVGFSISGNKGFHITFENGLTVSVQFGWGNYCENYDVGSVMDKKPMQSANAEIAIWSNASNDNDSSTWLTREFDPGNGDDVIGYCSPAKVLEALNWAANYKKVTVKS